jgi:hypothetical protein
MAKDKDEILKANTGAPAANIPDLKKKEKERKKAGAAWSGARGAASEFSGATGGNVARAAASAAGMAGEGAAELAAEAAAELGAEGGGFFARLFGAVADFFASVAESLGFGEAWAAFTASTFGRMAIAAAAMLLVAAAGLIGYALLKGNGGASLGDPNLGGITDSMHVRFGGNDRFGAKGGDIRFDPLSASKPAPAAPPTDAKAADEKKVPEKLDADAQKPVPTGLLAHNLSGAQLSTSLGGNFGGKNIFAGNSNAPKYNSGASNLKKYPGAPGQLGKMATSRARATPSRGSINKGSANKAFGQARIANGMSTQGAGASTAEQAASAAQGAFDQQQPTGGNLATNGGPGDAPGSDTPPNLGGGAPDTSIPAPPADPPGSYKNPGLQNSLNQIQQMAQTGMQNIKTGTMMMMLGAVLVGIGIAIGWPFGAVLVAMGVAMIAAGYMKMKQGQGQIAAAQQMGQQLASQIGNQQQGDAIQDCTNKMAAAANNGNTMNAAQCNEDQVVQAPEQSAQDAADIQRVRQIPVGSANITTSK